MPRTFLTAEWRYLAMLNYAIDPALLAPRVPPGTELDSFDRTTFISVVGFHFRHTRVMGLPVPFHRHFEEVNLRFYVRHKAAGVWRRGVVFIRELVPRRAIAFLARTFYREPYTALPMRHAIEHTPEKLSVEYAWRSHSRWESIHATAAGEARPVQPGSLEEFITEHYWGYTAHKNRCTEYQVEHPPWRVWHAATAELHADIATLYGPEFSAALSTAPASAFIADGSPIIVRNKSDIPSALAKNSPAHMTGIDYPKI